MEYRQKHTATAASIAITMPATAPDVSAGLDVVAEDKGADGADEGGVDGDWVGILEGWGEGLPVGTPEGLADGLEVGSDVGTPDGLRNSTL